MFHFCDCDNPTNKSNLEGSYMVYSPPPVFTVNMEAGLRPSLWRSAAYRLALRGLLILLS